MHPARRIRERLGSMSVRETVRGVLDGYERNDLLTFASAIAFQVLFAIIPLTLLGLGLLGGLGLEDQWTGEWGPHVRDSVSEPVFAVVDDTVRRIVEERRAFWMTAGGVIAVWEISGATRGIMDVFDRIYGSSRKRPFLERLRVSLLLGVAVAALLLAAVGVVVLGDEVIDHPLALYLRWPLALALLLAVVALLVTHAPVEYQPLHWVTFGSIVVVTAWVGTSAVLGWYLTQVADYGNVFGALATVVVVMTYLYFATAAFLTGAQIDALVRARR